jgi:hypothetical protein
MKLSNKQKKTIMANLFEIFEKDQATAVEIPDHNGKLMYVMLRPDVFSDLHTENQQMKLWVDSVARHVFSMQDDAGMVKMEDISKMVTHLNLMAVDGISRFMGYNPAEAMKESLDE